MMAPSMRVMVRVLKNHPKNQNSNALPVSTPRSKVEIPPKGRGRIAAAQPNTRKMLNILLPITLPKAIPELPFTAATRDVASSGREVPAATMRGEATYDHYGRQPHPGLWLGPGGLPGPVLFGFPGL